MKDVFIGNSIVRGMNSRNWETICLPGADWQRISEYVLDHGHRLSYSRVYIHIGPVQYSKRVFVGDQRQYILQDGPTDPQEFFGVCSNTLTRHHITLIFCTLYPMSFERYNLDLCRDFLSASRRRNYQESTSQIQRLVVRANRRIVKYNEKGMMVTPFLHRQIFTRRRGKYSFRDQFLSDGLHPRTATTREWTNILERAVRMNRAADHYNR